MSMVKLDRVSKFYKVKNKVIKGIDDISIEFNLNEIVAITGSSGGGKSTLLNAIGGIDICDSGELYINNKSAVDFAENEWSENRKSLISFIFQDYNIIDKMTVLENVLMVSKYGKEDKKKAKEIVRKVGLENVMRKRASLLSGGEKQRVAIARALMKDCKIILADEPTGNLDISTSKEILTLLKEISKDRLILIVTHDYEIVRKIATRLVEMDKGKIILDKVKKNYDANTFVSIDKKEINLGIVAAKRYLKSKLENSINLIIIFLCSILLFFSYYYFIHKIPGDVYNWDTYRNAIILTKEDGSTFDELEVIKIKNNYNDTFSNVYVNDIKGKIEVVVGSTTTTENYSNVNNLFVFDVTKGRMSTDVDEVVIGAGNELGLQIGRTFKISNTLDVEHRNFKIVGITSNIEDKTIYFHDETFHENGRFLLECFDEKIITPQIIIEDIILSDVIYKNSKSHNIIYLSQKYKNKIKNNSKIFIKISNSYEEVEVECEILFYTEDKTMLDINIEEVLEKTSPKKEVDKVNIATYNIKETEKILKSLTKNSEYKILSEISMLKEVYRSEVKDAKITGTIVFIFLEIIVLLCMYFLLKIVFIGNKKEIGILKSLGYSNRNIRRIYLQGVLLNVCLILITASIVFVAFKNRVYSLELMISLFNVSDFIVLASLIAFNSILVTIFLVNSTFKHSIAFLLKGKSK